MKRKTVMLIMTGLMVLSLAACGSTSTPSTEESGQAQETSADAGAASSADAAEADQPAEETEENTTEFPADVPTDFYFASGVGAWSTDMTLHKDGSFFGEYHDSDMGDTGDGYPNGTVYISSFTGEFTDIQQLDEYTYEMTLSNVQTEQEEGVESIADEIRYVSSSAYGVESGSKCYLYLPGTPKANLSEDCLMWVHDDFFDENEDLTCYLIYNEEPGYTFIGDNVEE